MKTSSKSLASALLFILLVFLLFGFSPASAQTQASAPRCGQCATWNVPQTPFKVYGNTYYVGPHGLSSILIDSGAGLVLIDGALPDSVPQILANMRSLGFRIEDVKLILNSHAHYDHAGGIAELQRLSGATVVASKWSAPVLSKGIEAKDDPQYGQLFPYPPIANVRTLLDGEVIHIGNVTLTPHATPGHTPGGTSWTWQSCESARCLNVVYMDSVSAVSVDGYKYTQRPGLSQMQDFDQSLHFLETTPCDILLTPHPDISDLWSRLEKRTKGVTPDPMIDPNACRTVTTAARAAVQKRVASETGH